MAKQVLTSDTVRIRRMSKDGYKALGAAQHPTTIYWLWDEYIRELPEYPTAIGYYMLQIYVDHLGAHAEWRNGAGVYRARGSVPTYNDLPKEGLEVGDVYNVLDTGMNYAWTGEEWDPLGGNFDFSNYVSQQEFKDYLVTERSISDAKYLPISDSKAFALKSALQTVSAQVDVNTGDISTALGQIAALDYDKQNKLTAGENITIEDNVISATGGTGGIVWDKEFDQDVTTTPDQQYLGITFPKLSDGVYQFYAYVRKSPNSDATPENSEMYSKFIVKTVLTIKNGFYSTDLTELVVDADSGIAFTNDATVTQSVFNRYEDGNGRLYLKSSWTMCPQVQQWGVQALFKNVAGVSKLKNLDTGEEYDLSVIFDTDTATTPSGSEWNYQGVINAKPAIAINIPTGIVYSDVGWQDDTITNVGLYNMPASYWTGKRQMVRLSFTIIPDTFNYENPQEITDLMDIEILGAAASMPVINVLKRTGAFANKEIACGYDTNKNVFYIMYKDGTALNSVLSDMVTRVDIVCNSFGMSNEPIIANLSDKKQTDIAYPCNVQYVKEGLINQATNPSSSVAIGTATGAGGAVSIGAFQYVANNASNSIVLGNAASAQSGATQSIAIGYSASTQATGAIQIGKGDNNKPNTLNVGLGGKNYQLLDESGHIPKERLNDVVGSAELEAAFTTDAHTNIFAHASMPKGVYVDLSAPGGQETIFVAPTDGWAVARISGIATAIVEVRNNSLDGLCWRVGSAGNSQGGFIPISSGNQYMIGLSHTPSVARFYYCQGTAYIATASASLAGSGTPVATVAAATGTATPLKTAPSATANSEKITYYKLSEDGTYIEYSSPFAQAAADFGMDKQTTEEIVRAWNGLLYLESECPEEPVEHKQETIRDIRNRLLETEVDPVVSNSLRWADMSDAEQAEYTAYRTYLLDYTKTPLWYEKNPLTLDEWKKEQENDMQA